MKKKQANTPKGKQGLSEEQMALARVLAIRHELDIPSDRIADYKFCRNFINLFAYDPDSGTLTGFRRVSVIVSYLYFDKDQGHLQRKLELSAEEVAFMVMVLSLYRYKGALPRENQYDLDPEATYFREAEQKLYEAAH